MHLLSSLHFLVKQFLLLLLLGLLLLIANQVLDHGGLRHMLIALMVMQLPLLHLLLFGVVHILFYFLAVRSLIVKNFLSLFLLLRFMQKSYLCLLVHFHLHS